MAKKSQRDFVMARVAAASAMVRSADQAIHEFLGHMVDPGEDESGSERAELLEAIDETLTAAAASVQAAMAEWKHVDTEEGEEGVEDDDDDDDDDDDEDDDEEEEAERPRRRR